MDRWHWAAGRSQRTGAAVDQAGNLGCIVDVVGIHTEYIGHVECHLGAGSDNG